MSCERLEQRRLLALITGADLGFGDRGEAVVDGSLLLSTTGSSKLIAAGPDKAVRLNADGSIDRTFRDAGLPTVEVNQSIFISSALRTDSQIIFGGALNNQTTRTSDVFLRAIRAGTGRADTSFGNEGMLTLSPEPLISNSRLAGVSVVDLEATPGGGFIAAISQFLVSASDGLDAAALYKFTGAGAIDTTFAGDGVLELPVGLFVDGLETDSQGRILVITTGANDQFISRYLANGTIDMSFGAAGRKRIGGLSLSPLYHAIALQPDGKIVLAGETLQDLFSTSGFRRLNADGSDDTFGSDGTLFTNDKIINIVVDAQGRVTGNTRSRIFRINADGTRDATFSDDGVSPAGEAILPRSAGNRSAAIIDDAGELVVGTSTHVTRFVRRGNVILERGRLRVDGSTATDQLIVDFSESLNSFTVTLNNQVRPFDADEVDDIAIFTGPGFGNIDVSGDRQARIVTGNDFDSITVGDGGSVIDSRRGTDTIITGAGKDDVMLGANGRVSTGAGRDNIKVSEFIDNVSRPSLNGGGGPDVIDAGPSVAIVNGGGGDDLIRNSGNRDRGSITVGNPYSTLLGGEGDDTIVGVPGNDSIDGGIGDDSLEGGSSHDIISGGEGNDTLRGGDFADTLRGDAGNDLVRGGAGGDLIFGSPGNDDLYGDGSNDRVYGDAGNDFLSGDAGDDLVRGDDGRDTVNGGRDDDTLEGGLNRDFLFGQAGNDNLAGNGGDDYFNPGPGADTARGNAGDDEFLATDGEIDRIFGDGGVDVAQADANDILVSIETTTT